MRTHHPPNHSYAKIKNAELDLPSAPSSLINGVVPVGWGEAHLSQIHVECLYNQSSIAFHTQ